MFKGAFKRFTSLFITLVMVFTLIPKMAISVSAIDLDINVEGLSASTDKTGWTITNGNITSPTLKTTGGRCGNTTASSTLTLTNTFNSTVDLTLTWSKNPTYGSLKIGNDNTNGSSGTKTIRLSPQEAVNIIVTSADSDDGINTGIKISISNISTVIVPLEATVTFAVGANGSYTVDDNLISTNTSIKRFSNIPFVN